MQHLLIADRTKSIEIYRLIPFTVHSRKKNHHQNQFPMWFLRGINWNAHCYTYTYECVTDTFENVILSVYVYGLTNCALYDVNTNLYSLRLFFSLSTFTWCTADAVMCFIFVVAILHEWRQLFTDVSFATFRPKKESDGAMNKVIMKEEEIYLYNMLDRITYRIVSYRIVSCA